MFDLKERVKSLQEMQRKGNPPLPLDLNREDLPTTHCLNCGTDFRGHYCPNCGQKATTKRLTWKNLIAQAMGVLTNMERGFIHTSLELFYRPGYLIRDYIAGRRANYNKPLPMLFVLATVHLLVHYLFFKNSGLPDLEANPSSVQVDNESLRQLVMTITEVAKQIFSNKAISTLTFVIFLIIPNWLVFKLTRYGKRLNLIEHFHIMLFVACQDMILSICQIPYNWIIGEDDESLLVFGSLLSIIITIWDIKQIFHIGRRKSFALMTLSFILAVILFFVTITIVLAVYIFLFAPELKDQFVA